jgi:WD40 repeat protein
MRGGVTMYALAVLLAFPGAFSARDNPGPQPFPELLPGQSTAIWGLALSSDGKALASCASHETVVRIRNPVTLESQLTLEGHKNKVFDIAFSPDNKSLISVSPGDPIRIWDVASGKVRATFGDGTFRHSRLVISPDGSILATASTSEEQVVLWEVKTGKVLATLRGHAEGVWSMAFDAHGNSLAIGGGDGKIRIWDVGNRTLTTTLSGHGNLVAALSFHSDGKGVLSASPDNSIRRWDLASGKAEVTVIKPPERLQVMAFSPDLKLLATGDAVKSVTVWEVATGKATAHFDAHKGGVNSLVFGPTGDVVISGGWDQKVKRWAIAPAGKK